MQTVNVLNSAYQNKPRQSTPSFSGTHLKTLEKVVATSMKNEKLGNRLYATSMLGGFGTGVPLITSFATGLLTGMATLGTGLGAVVVGTGLMAAKAINLSEKSIRNPKAITSAYESVTGKKLTPRALEHFEKMTKIIEGKIKKGQPVRQLSTEVVQNIKEVGSKERPAGINFRKPEWNEIFKKNRTIAEQDGARFSDDLMSFKECISEGPTIKEKEKKGFKLSEKTIDTERNLDTERNKLLRNDRSNWKILGKVEAATDKECREANKTWAVDTVKEIYEEKNKGILTSIAGLFSKPKVSPKQAQKPAFGELTGTRYA